MEFLGTLVAILFVLIAVAGWAALVSYVIGALRRDHQRPRPIRVFFLAIGALLGFFCLVLAIVYVGCGFSSTRW